MARCYFEKQKCRLGGRIMREKKAEQRLTTIRVTTTLKRMEELILEESGLSKAAFHRRAIDAFVKNNGVVDAQLKIKAKTDPRYVKKPERELVYLDEERKQLLERIALRENTGITIVLYQAIMDYCIEMKKILPEDKLNEILEE